MKVEDFFLILKGIIMITCWSLSKSINLSPFLVIFVIIREEVVVSDQGVLPNQAVQSQIYI